MANKKKPVVLISLDGWGASSVTKGNAIEQAKTPVMDSLYQNYPFAFVKASGIAVGLPWGEVGNSEVGHLNLGAGKVIYQNLPRIKLSIENGKFHENEHFTATAKHAKDNKSSLHLMGILSNGGVHGHIDHGIELLKMCKQQKCKKNVYVHAIMDGRDTPPDVGKNFIEQLQKAFKDIGVGELATMTGRYYAMDRNKNWDRTRAAYEMMTQGKGGKFQDPLKAIDASYKNDIKDEKMKPVVMVDKKEHPVATVRDEDSVIFWNYRPDRARQITKAFVLDDFSGFERQKLKDLKFATMMQYEEGLPVDVAFPPQIIKEPVGKVIADAGLKQLRLAETEKYAHVTYFFNGGSEKELKNEERELIQSPNVPSYDQKPEMAAPQIADKAVEEIESGKYDFIMINFANTDMVGHTGNFEAAQKGIEAVDAGIGKIVEAVNKAGGATVITADHGNAEQMKDPLEGSEVKEHSTDPVPLIVVDEERKRELDAASAETLRKQPQPVGILADVGPTVLDLMGLKPSKEMTTESLLNDLM